MHKTHHCGELRLHCVGQTVTLCGWLSHVRDKGAIVFITLRDHYGMTQAVITDDALKNKIRSIPRESTIELTGKVAERQDSNPDMPTGQIEIIPEKIELLGRCMSLLPFEIASSKENHDDLRLKYRYLDLRNPLVHNNMILRSQVIQKIRELMIGNGFLEIQTPILTSSSPEGARDYVVPSRLHPGKFYALPQAPQQFKQLLMLSGFDKYFQIAPCFRDEDARADRSPGEFYQLDMEMAFAEQEDVFTVIEDVLYQLFTAFSTWKMAKPPFTRIPYITAMNEYGSDKPDLRNPLRLKDVTPVFAGSVFKAFQNQSIKAICVTGAAGSPRKLFDRLTEEMVTEGAKGLVWLKVLADGTLSGSAAKFISEEETKALIEATAAKADDVLFMIADENEKALKLSGLLRNKLGKVFSLVNEDSFAFCWIVDFPMFETDAETGAIAFSHNPFSMPQGGMDALKNKNPLDILAYQYDIVCNGIELSSGAVRNHDPEIMIEAFRIAGYPAEVVEAKFPALFHAFQFGAPPHAGIAPGVDRIVMLLANEPNIREVIAFPMNKNAQDLLMNAPSEITDKQLTEVHIRSLPTKKQE